MFVAKDTSTDATMMPPSKDIEGERAFGASGAGGIGHPVLFVDENGRGGCVLVWLMRMM